MSRKDDAYWAVAYFFWLAVATGVFAMTLWSGAVMGQRAMCDKQCHPFVGTVKDDRCECAKEAK